MGTALTPILSRKLRKLAEDEMLRQCFWDIQGDGERMGLRKRGGLTIGSRVHDNKSSVYLGGVFSTFPVYSVGMSPKTVSGFEEIHIVVCRAQGPESCDARAARANNGHFFSSYVTIALAAGDKQRLGTMPVQEAGPMTLAQPVDGENRWGLGGAQMVHLRFLVRHLKVLR